MVIIVETWLKPYVDLSTLFSEFTSEYEFFRCDRTRKKGGGVLILVKRSLLPSLVFTESVIDSYELLSCDLVTSSGIVRIISAYKTPSCNAAFFKQLLKAFSDLISCDRLCVVTGDLNLPDIEWTILNKPKAVLPSSKAFLEFCQNACLTQHVFEATHGSNILDLILSTDSKVIVDVNVGAPIGASDHAAVFFKINLVSKGAPYILKRNYKDADFEAILSYLSNIDWYGSFSCVNTVDEMYEIFITVLQHSIDLYVPLKKVCPINSHLPSYLLALNRKRFEAWQKAKNDDSPHSWAAFKKLTQTFEKRLRKFNDSIEKKIIESKNQSSFYALLNSRLKEKFILGALNKCDGTIARTDMEKAEVFGEVFASSYTHDSDHFLQNDLSYFTGMNDSAWFYAEEIYELISGCPNSSSLTPDHIPLSFLKNVAISIVKPLEYLFNLSFMRAEVPSRWKVSYVTPILKKPPQYLPENYRPVSITSALARLFEKILKKRIEEHLRLNSVISPLQHGFQKGRSTVTAMLQAVNDWTTCLDQGISTDVIYFDFSKAFDKVSHAKLICKLQQVGIHPRIIRWICSFLLNRTFRVRVNSTLSRPRNAPSGVPQGGVLSPLLFLIYCYELPSLMASLGVGCSMFADDLKIYRGISTANDCQILQRAIDALHDWSVRWKLPLSREKTKFLHIGSRRHIYDYTIVDDMIVKTEEVRDLGFLVAKDLSFDAHCDHIVSIAIKMVHNLFRALSTKNVAVLLRAYKIYIRPLLEYGTVIYSPYKLKYVRKIESVQNSFTRKLMNRVVGFSYDKIPTSNERNINFSLDSLAMRRKRFDLLMCHKILHGNTGLDPRAFFRMKDSVTRGGSIKFCIPRARLKCRSNFFAVRVISDYTKLSKVKDIPCKMSSFKAFLGGKSVRGIIFKS